MRSAKTTTNQCELIPDSISAASAIPARSAAMLIVLAAIRARTKAPRSQLGNRRLKFPARPCPVTIPIRAHIICTAAINGHVRSAVQRSLVPSCAPATEYVAMPDGSSSAAPVITPGPSDFNSNRIHRAGANVDTIHLHRKRHDDRQTPRGRIEGGYWDESWGTFSRGPIAGPFKTLPLGSKREP